MREEIETLREALKLYSPTGREARFAEFLAGKMVALGFDRVRIDGVGNAIGEVGKGESPTVLFCSHMDTVPGYLRVSLKKDRITGRGAVDAKASLISMLFAASRLKDYPGRVIYAGVVDEEGRGRGMKGLINEGIRPDYAIIGEPSNLVKVTVGYKGRLCVKFVCETETAHASTPWLASNSIVETFRLHELIGGFVKEFNEKVKGGKFRKLTSTITQIHGGSGLNVLPSKTVSVFDFRLPPGLKSDEVVEKLQELVQKLDGRFIIEIIDKTEAIESSRSSPIVRALVRAIVEVLKLKPAMVNKTGTADMNTIGNALGIPVVSYGPGDPRLSHTREEVLRLEDYLKSIEIYRKTALNLLKLIR